MYYSYVMGIGNKVEALGNDGFIIEKFDNNYGVALNQYIRYLLFEKKASRRRKMF